MDKNTIIGFGLIAAIVIGFTWFNKPSKEQLEQQKKYNDSIAQVQQKQAVQAKIDSAKFASQKDSASINDTTTVVQNEDASGAFSIS